ncbi:MAG: hypothetical protein K0Q87_187 [Neobacillus sp.]|jgi:hypothetical protein|nr:hypothetical protein [Neobacillus sp.]
MNIEVGKFYANDSKRIDKALITNVFLVHPNNTDTPNFQVRVSVVTLINKVPKNNFYCHMNPDHLKRMATEEVIKLFEEQWNVYFTHQ